MGTVIPIDKRITIQNSAQIGCVPSHSIGIGGSLALAQIWPRRRHLYWRGGGDPVEFRLGWLMLPGPILDWMENTILTRFNSPFGSRIPKDPAGSEESQYR